MLKLPQPPFPVPFPVPANTDEAIAHTVHLTEGIDATKPSGDAAFVVGMFTDGEQLLAAAKAARAAGHNNLQAWSPYPVNGLDPVLGLQRSLIGRPVFTVALCGFLFTFIGICYLMTSNWTVIYGGKPFFTWQLWVVPTLEAGLLFAAVTNLKLVLHTCKLLPDPFSQVPDPRVSDDYFALAISTCGHSSETLTAFLQSAGAVAVTTIDAAVAAGAPIFRPLPDDASAGAAHA